MRLVPLSTVVPEEMKSKVESMANKYAQAQLAKCPVGDSIKELLTRSDPACDLFCSKDPFCSKARYEKCRSGLGGSPQNRCCCDVRNALDSATPVGCGALPVPPPVGDGQTCSGNGSCNPMARTCLCDAEHGGKDCLLQLVPMSNSFGGQAPQRGVVELWGSNLKEEDAVRIAACKDGADDEYNQRWWSVDTGPTSKRELKGSRSRRSAVSCFLGRSIMLSRSAAKCASISVIFCEDVEVAEQRSIGLYTI